MAVRRRHADVGQAFRNDRQLQQFLLTDVTPTGRVLGTGSYGSVEEVSYKHLVCAGKKLHETLIDMENEGVAEVVSKYLQECQLMSSLHHPNITQFLGLCFLPGTQLPLLVMERLETSLDDLLEHMPNLPLSLKCSVLEDVACGLLYLHDRCPPVIHRDLTSKNVLLTSSLVAKITDMGNSRIVTMRPGEMARTLTKYPGTLVYMPPEVQDDTHRYGAAMDVFSFGHLALFTLTQKFPGDLLPSTYVENRQIRGRSEIERRGGYIELLEGKINAEHPALVDLVKQCLQNDPPDRPSTEELLTRLQGVRMEVEGEYGGGMPIKLDMVRLRLVKEVKEQTRKVEELTQQQTRHETELETMRNNVDEITRQLEERVRRVEELQADVQVKDNHIHHKDNQIHQLQTEEEELRRQLELKDGQVKQLQTEVRDQKNQLAAKDNQMTAKDDLIAIKDELVTRKDREIATKDTQLQEFEVREAGLRRELAALREAIKNYQQKSPGKDEKEPLKLPLQLTWRHGPDMPFEMSGYIQSVVVQGKLYVGGGFAPDMFDDERVKIVMKYDIPSGKWTTLPPYTCEWFSMAVINSQLVLVVGGYGSGSFSKVSVWGAGSKTWTHPYPEMPTARSDCSVVVHNEWLVVAGGWASSVEGRLSCVEVLNTDTKQWYTGPPTPTPWNMMKTAVVGDMAYFMGGNDNASAGATEAVYSVSIPTLISITSRATSGRDRQIWKKIPGLQLTWSTPLSISGSLLVVGGQDKDGNKMTAIHLYQPDTMKWVKVGDLPSPRSGCTCATIIPDREIIVAGGDDGPNILKTVDLARLTS